MDIEKIFKANMKREQSEKIAKYNVLNTFAQKGKILFTGSSLMEQFPINELLMTAGIDVYKRQPIRFPLQPSISVSAKQTFRIPHRPMVISVDQTLDRNITT